MAEIALPSSNRAADASQSTRISERRVVSEPLRVILVERVRVSEEQRSSVTSAIRSGRDSVRTKK